MTFQVVKWVAIAALAGGLSGFVDPWYIVINYVVFISGLYGSWIARQHAMYGWSITLALIAIIFNPFAPPAFFDLYEDFIEIASLMLFLLSPPELNMEVMSNQQDEIE